VVIAFGPKKDAINRSRHGLSLAFAEQFDWTTARYQAARTVNGEPRDKVLALVDGRLYAGIFTRRGLVFWMISVRPASRKERREYAGKTEVRRSRRREPGMDA